ncbi:MAG: hypothetical protein KatS3mg081_0772 [Gemmatimonadales bacterium]|nr:hypothetical protein HRbin33_00035 [bacterium HR33]GIW51417.1 MAG: hypothetical protein KatS3mg081_0772 [Gemmatimonadales bacterium]
MNPIHPDTLSFWTWVSVGVLVAGPPAVFVWFLREVRSWFRNPDR